MRSSNEYSLRNSVKVRNGIDLRTAPKGLVGRMFHYVTFLVCGWHEICVSDLTSMVYLNIGVQMICFEIIIFRLQWYSVIIYKWCDGMMLRGVTMMTEMSRGPHLVLDLKEWKRMNSLTFIVPVMCICYKKARVCYRMFIEIGISL